MNGSKAWEFLVNDYRVDEDTAGAVIDVLKAFGPYKVELMTETGKALVVRCTTQYEFEIMEKAEAA